jgi:two-component system, NtrC family, sensor kinase
MRKEFDEEGHGEGIFRHAPDITHRQGKPEAGDTDELAALGRLAAGAVHEMNNSLGIVLCHAQLLLRDVPADDPIARDVAVIELHARNCARIAGDLLQRARGRKCMLEGQE